MSRDWSYLAGSTRASGGMNSNVPGAGNTKRKKFIKMITERLPFSSVEAGANLFSDKTCSVWRIAEGRRSHVCHICAATTCKVALSSLVFFVFVFFHVFVHVDNDYVRVTVVNGLRIMTIL